MSSAKGEKSHPRRTWTWAKKKQEMIKGGGGEIMEKEKEEVAMLDMRRPSRE